MEIKQLLQLMEQVVKNHVIAYQSDFYDYDIATITRMKTYERRFWLVRDTGTYLFTDPDIAKTVMDCDNYIYFAVIYRDQYEYEYTSMNKEAFCKELDSWIDNDFEQVKSDLLHGIIYGETRGGSFYPLLSFKDGTVYVTDKYGANASCGLDDLKDAIYNILEHSPHNLLQMEQRTIDNWYL